ncbi:hypothetical protein [Kitasatospora cathayae]|uniref:Secreted protein n=1 Tax=Kitasatospora cathayae TaxID=3004092 RepID=A0ABY7Q537_9ACTN|nr:hypothetical protein [Kitasatospora sp. HUAS 3-15]WBP87749.1 hypothetical protein O1G21_19120 [Kitasatospora sp. HUAS 3-15]
MLNARRLLSTALLATTALGLAACGPNDSGDSSGTGTATAAASTAPTVAATGGTAKPAPTGNATAGTDNGPQGICTHEPLPAGQKWVIPAKGTSATALVYQDTKDECGVNDVQFTPTGANKTAPFAPTAKGHLNSVVVAPKEVDVAALVKHINECIATPHDSKGSYPCQNNYFRVTLDASGKVVDMVERAES